MRSNDLTRRAFVAGLSVAPVAGGAETAPFAGLMAKAQRIEQLHSLVITRHGQILAAEAFRGPALDVPVNVKSVSKSLISALTGIALQRGELTSTDQLIAPLLRRSVPRRADPRIHQITIEHMLSMRSGLQEVSGAAYGEWVGAKHWIYTALSKPIVAEPGTSMLYSTASYHILGAILSRVAGQDLHSLAQSRLGDPLGIDIPPWTQDPQGRYVGGNDMRLSPLAMVRFGELYRRGGEWNGKRILTGDWIVRSWSPLTQSTETGHGYGFGWFIWSAGGHDVFYARGYGGQMIYIVPALSLCVAITSDSGRPATPDGHLGVLNRLFAEQIVPTVENAI